MSDKITKQELQKDIEFIGGIIISTREILRNFELISQYHKSDSSINKIEGFLIHYMTLGWSQCSINISKLFSESQNEKRSFIKLMNKLENRRYNQSIVEILSDNKSNNKTRTAKNHNDLINIISKCRNKISEHQSLIEKVLNRRNNVYAHAYTDAKQPDQKSNTIETRDELNKLVALATYVFDQIFGEIFGTSWPTETKFYSIEPVLKSIIKKN